MRRFAVRPALRRIALPTVAATVASLVSLVIVSPGAHAEAGPTAVGAVGTVYGLGDNQYASLGLNGHQFPDQFGLISVDASITPITGVIQAAAGQSVGLVLTSAGTVLASGDNSANGLATGTAAGTQDYFAPVNGLPNNIVKVAAGYQAAMALASDGSVYVWDSVPVRPGHASGVVTTPELENYFPVGVTIVDIATDGFAMYFLGGNGLVYATGVNGFGELGNGTTSPSATPVQVLTAPGGPPLTNVTKVVAGTGLLLPTFCAIDTSHDLWCWGSSSFSRQCPSDS